MYPLYPDIKPYARHRLPVDDLHELYLDESGDPNGIPVLFVHGGPGSGCEFDSRGFFDPEKYHIILFDQRGSGRSTPHAEIARNTLADLLADMEKIREFLKLDRWLLFGGGWGATLSVAYAEAYPERVLGMVLRGVFLGRKRDINWIYQEGASAFFPDHWKEYADGADFGARSDLVQEYHKRVTGSDDLARMGAAKAWSLWEAHCSTLHPNRKLIEHYGDPHRALARARVGSHYFVNDCFLDDNQLVEQAHRLDGVPGIIVHGRYDMVCRLESAYLLHEAWNASQLYIVREAGHAATEPTLIDALVRATRDMAQRLESEMD